MLNSRKRKPTVHPPFWVREKILKKYYNDLQTMDHIDAYIAYDTAMHHAYCQLNPHLKYVATSKSGPPKMRKLLTRKNFKSSTDRFGTPLWVLRLNEEELNSQLTREEINKERKAKRMPLV